MGHGFLIEKGSLAQKIYSCPFSSHVLWLKRQTYILGAVENFGSNFGRVKKCENEGQNENQKKAVKLAPKDYVKTLIWFFGGFGVEKCFTEI